MFRIFKRRGDKPALMYGIWQRAGQAIERRQRAWANHLNKQLAGVSSLRLFIGLVIFCAGFGGGAAYVLWQSLSTPSNVSVKLITVPKKSAPPPSEQPVSPMSEEQEQQQMRRFLHYLDSLEQTPTGKQWMDGMRRYRPAFMDSLATIRQLYREQLKTNKNE